MLRGHLIEERDGKWVYSDTQTTSTEHREACGHCGKRDTVEGHDGCLGTLYGVMNACCGHGVAEEAYVQFESGDRLGGREALQWVKQSGRRPD